MKSIYHQNLSVANHYQQPVAFPFAYATFSSLTNNSKASFYKQNQKLTQ